MEKIKEEEVQDKNYDMLYKRREFLDSVRIKASDSFDKYLLTFATGSLYLTINFANSYNGILKEKTFLAIGWTFLIISIVNTLISFTLSEKAHGRQIKITDEQIEALPDNKIIVNSENFWNSVISFANCLSVSAFILGIVFLTYFYFINLK